MNRSFHTASLATGAVAGLAAYPLGSSLVASGAVPAAGALVLGLAAVSVAVTRSRRETLPPRGGLHVRASFGSRDAGLPHVRPALTPLEWLKSIGAGDVCLEDLPSFLKARLVGDLTFHGPQTRFGPHLMPDRRTKALAVALAARHLESGTPTRELLSALASERSDGSVLAAGTATETDDRVAALQAREEVSRVLDATLGRHGSLETYMTGLLHHAKVKGGVTATAEFLWLKETRRSLWYTLNNHGRRSFHVEGVAAMAHYRAELASGQALYEPRVEDAVESLREFETARRTLSNGPRGA